MIDQVFGRELPPMQEWSKTLLDEAIRCKVEFGLLVPGQGSVTARMIQAMPKAKMAIMKVTYDPRDRLVDMEIPAEMRFIGEIRHPSNNFSLMKPPADAARNAAAKLAAKRLIARAKSAAGPNAKPTQPRRYVRADPPAKRA